MSLAKRQPLRCPTAIATRATAAVAVWLLVCAWGAGPTFASPIFAGTSPNGWILNDDGTTAAEYRVGGGNWTYSLIQFPPSVRFLYNGGTIVLPDGGGTRVLINLTNSSAPPLDTALPSLSLVGLGSPASNLANLAEPSATLTPDEGTYMETIQVTAHGIHAPSGAGLFQLHYRINGGTTVTTAAEKVSFFLVANGNHDVEYWAEEGGVSSPIQQETFIVNATDPSRDTDGDGVPDVWEAANGLDPLVSDGARDSDGDGWTDFEEKIRGSDPDNDADTPTDTDGDGWSDYDEVVRFTNPNDSSDFPSDVRRSEVEYRVTGGIWDDIAATIPKLNIVEFTTLSVFWRERIVTDDLSPLELAGLDAGVVPAFRVPAGDSLIVRARHEDGSGEPDAWVAKLWLDSSPDVLPGGVTDYLIGKGTPWRTAGDWELGYKNYLMDNLVKDRTVDITPATGTGIALVESLVAWYDQLAGEGPVLLGNIVSPQPVNALHNLLDVLNVGNLDGLHADLTSLLGSGLPLEPFALAVAGYYADLQSFTQSTVTRAAAALAQGSTEDDLDVARYIPRLLSQMPLAEIQALTPGDQALILDPLADFDGDGIANDDEFAEGPLTGSLPSDDDTDGDGRPDDQDPCPMEFGNTCLRIDYLVMDTDGDGYVDSIDNCMNDPNTMQDDANGDGIGDACLRHANIVRPVSNVRLFVGDSVNFSSVETELWSGNPMTYLWDFQGAAPNSTSASPGDVVFNLVGDYTIEFIATDQGSSLGSDRRRVVVQGVGPLPTVVIGGPYAIDEGDLLGLNANASSQNGAILSYDWSFGDAGFQSGNPTSHVYASEGVYLLEVEIVDAFLLKASDATTVTVADSVPTADFVATAQPGPPFSYQFTDLSTAYDGIVSWSWDFGDGDFSNLQDPSHLFPGFGSYDVSLSVVDGDGSGDVIVMPVVFPIPTPALGPLGIGLLAALLGLAGSQLLPAGRRASAMSSLARPDAAASLDGQTPPRAAG